MDTRTIVVLEGDQTGQELLEASLRVLQPDVVGFELALPRSDLSLGGEQSGHVIFLDHGTTGDGVLTGLMLAARVAETGRPLSDLAAVMKRLPQVLISVKGVDKSRVDSDEELLTAVKAEEAALTKDLKGDVAASWGDQMRNYVLNPYQIVKDLRTGHESGNPAAVFDGDLDAFMEAGIRWRRGAEKAEA